MKSTRVSLTELRTGDLPVMFDWINDRKQVLLSANYKPVSEVEHKEWSDAIARRNDTFIFAIRLDGDKLIGSCQLHSISYIHRSAELQIRLGDVAERGHGYGTDAVKLLLNFGFRDLNLHRVYLRVFSNNPAAIRVYEKAGFKQEGLLRKEAHIDGQYVDVVVMGILRDEYVAD